MLKPSKFNYSAFSDKGELLIGNTYSGSMVKTDADRAAKVAKLLQSDSIDGEDDEAKFLFRQGILVHSFEDENIKVEDLFVKVQSLPTLSIVILPTEQCNFRCVYCPESFQKGEMNVEVQDAIIRYVKTRIQNYAAVRVGWFGGEPLVAVNTIRYLSKEIMAVCKKHHKKYVSNMTTNGYLLDYNMFTELLSYNVLLYQITVDGLRESHDRQRVLINGGTTYDQIIKNLYAIRDNCKTAKFKIIFRINITKSMIPNIPEFIGWYKTEFSGDKRFALLIRLVGNLGGERVCNVSDELIDCGEEATIRLLISSFSDCGLENCALYNKRFFMPAGAMCFATLRNTIVFDSTGDVRRCTCALDDDINKFGDILRPNSVMDDAYTNSMWNIAHIEDHCKSCFYFPACMGTSCKYGIIKFGSNVCPPEKKYAGDYLRLFDKFGLLTIIE